MYYVKNIPLIIQDNEVFNQLGYTEDYNFKRHFLKLYNEEKQEAQDSIKPKAIFTIENIKSIPSKDIFNEAKEVAFCVVTIGLKLEQKVSKLTKQGKFERSVILDAIGSSTVEQIANFVNEKINNEARKRNYDYTKRFSPGYCTYDLNDQKLIFRKVPAEKINVTLTESMMMSPRKSISFAVNFGFKEEMDMNIGIRTCDYCDKINCKFNKNRRKNK